MTAQISESQATSSEAPKTPDVNLVNMRKQLEAERAEKAQMAARMAELEKMASIRSKSHDDDDDMGDEPYIDPKTFKKKMATERETIKKEAKEELKQEMRQILEDEKRVTYLKQNADFDHIMSPEIVQRFAEKHPGMAEAILRMPDGFERQRLVYEAIKTTGAHQKEMPKSSIQETVDKNRKNPYYMPSGVGTAPYASSGDFSPSGQKNAYEKLQQLKNNLRLG